MINSGSCLRRNDSGLPMFFLVQKVLLLNRIIQRELYFCQPNQVLPVFIFCYVFIAPAL